MVSSKMHFTGQVNDFDLRLLRVFKTVVECGSFSAAEVELNVSGSAISLSMTDLERRGGFKLCNRGRAGFSLTDEGHQIYDEVIILLDSIDTFRNKVNAVHSSLKGAINIGITDNLITLHYTRIVNSLKMLKDKAPDVAINIHTLPPNEIEKSIFNGKLDIGVVPQQRLYPGLDYYPIYDEQSLLYCGEEHPLFEISNKKELVKLIGEKDTVAPAYALSDEIKAIYEKFNVTATTISREGVTFLLLTGRFIGFLPTHYAKIWVDEGVMKSLLPDVFNYITTYTVITNSGQQSDQVLDAYLKELRNTH